MQAQKQAPRSAPRKEKMRWNAEAIICRSKCVFSLRIRGSAVYLTDNCRHEERTFRRIRGPLIFRNLNNRPERLAVLQTEENGIRASAWSKKEEARPFVDVSWSQTFGNAWMTDAYLSERRRTLSDDARITGDASSQ